jgi:hypothetical protein
MLSAILQLCSFLMKTAQRGSVCFSFQTTGLALFGLKTAENELKTTYISDRRLSLGENVLFQK